MHYIYLNYYQDNYLYVGSHTWDGQGIDPNYFGSSGVAEFYKFSLLRIKLLEVVTPERKLIAEREWIERYAKRFGIADCALHLAYNHKDGWVNKFRSGGRMLNLHANDAQDARDALKKKIIEFGFTDKQKQASASSIRIAQKVSVENKKKYGITLAQKRALDLARIKHIENVKLYGLSEERKEKCRSAIRIAQRALVDKVKRDGLSEAGKERCREAIKVANAAAALKVRTYGLSEAQLLAKMKIQPIITELAHTKESMSKMVESRNRNGSYSSGAIKAAETQRLRNSNPGYKDKRIVRVVYNGEVYEGAVKTVCEKIGNPNWSCTVSKKFREKGTSVVHHHGVEFFLLEVIKRN